MIPFNHLGWLFKRFGSSGYPHEAVEGLCDFLRPVAQNASLLDLGAGTGVLSELAFKCRDDLQFSSLDPAEGMLRYVPHYVRTHKECFDLDVRPAIIHHGGCHVQAA